LQRLLSDPSDDVARKGIKGTPGDTGKDGLTETPKSVSMSQELFTCILSAVVLEINELMLFLCFPGYYSLIQSSRFGL